MQNAGSALSALDKQVNAITIEAARLIEDKKDGLPSKVQNGQISGSNREMYLNNLLDQLPDLKAQGGGAHQLRLLHRHSERDGKPDCSEDNVTADFQSSGSRRAA